ncbi:hypothetical protein SS209_01441 [Salmonella enterica subsp. enterica serovar Senftenberg str. SS209]|nr:hypothetical protein SS209_01441 [Salmonella enterica subsp. enterica serovar Senftenberg str. SS209]
MMAQAPYPA